MSSPCNVVIVISLPASGYEEIAAKHYARWQTAHPEGDYRGTDAVIDAFFARVCSGDAEHNGSQGQMLIFGQCANYPNADDLLCVLMPFVHEMEYGSATLFMQHEDSYARIYKIESDDAEPVELGSGERFSFDEHLHDKQIRAALEPLAELATEYMKNADPVLENVPDDAPYEGGGITVGMMRAAWRARWRD